MATKLVFVDSQDHWDCDDCGGTTCSSFCIEIDYGDGKESGLVGDYASCTCTSHVSTSPLFVLKDLASIEKLDAEMLFEYCMSDEEYGEPYPDLHKAAVYLDHLGYEVSFREESYNEYWNEDDYYDDDYDDDIDEEGNYYEDNEEGYLDYETWKE